MSLEQHYTLETPEQIEVDFDLAGPGSRFCAILIDWLLMWLLVFVILITGLTGFSLAGVFGSDPAELLGGWLAALLVALLGFLMLSGYHVVFEMLMGGQTPGKKSVGLRVLQEDGTPIALTASLTRNLLRIVDWMPAFYGVGGFVSVLHPMHKRLGDLAAGTIVVKETDADYRSTTDRRNPRNAGQPVSAPAAEASAGLTAEEHRMVRGFLDRRSELLPEARANLAQRLADRLHPKYGGTYDQAEAYLEHLIGENHHDAP